MCLLTPRKITTFFLLFMLIFVSISSAQKKKLTYNQVYKFQGPKLTKSLPEFKEWLDDKHYLVKKPFGEENKSTLVGINAETFEETVFLDYAQYEDKLLSGMSIANPTDQTSDYKYFLFTKENNLYHFSRESEKFTQLTDDGLKRVNTTLSPNGMKAAYTIDRDLYVFDIEKMEEIRITNDASDVIYNGYASWVYYEEILGRRSRYKAFWWSPDSKKLAFLKFDDSPIPIYKLYNPDGVHGEWEEEHYPKSGDPLPYVWFGISDLQSGKTAWADFDPKADHMIAWPFWHPNSKTVALQWIPRSFDEQKIFRINIEDGSKEEIYSEKQASWVDWFEDVYVFEDESGFIIRSDKDDWRHLYYHDWNGNEITKLTQGNWPVYEITHVDEKNSTVYFNAGKESTLETHLYKVGFKGGEITKLTQDEGTHKCYVSANGSHIIGRYSNYITPTQLHLLDSDGNKIKLLGDSKSEIMDDYQLGKVEMFTVSTDDGYELPVKWVLPSDFDKSKKYPIIFSVYGGPGSKSVSNSWGRFTSAHWYAQHGIIYAQMDNRASGHFGKKGMADVHRKLGVAEIDDFITVAKWANEQTFIDTTKIGVSGGSYGGYAVLMCLTRGADYFDYGIASASVTDWMLYDNVYTERFMDRPSENEEGYKNGSVMTYADQYRGMVRIIHGTLDDNVHPQNSLQLIDKFQDLDKDFEMMFYPKSRHGVRFPKFHHNMRENTDFWFRNLLGRSLDMGKD
jgi:dipeptidyl-peptidase-4